MIQTYSIILWARPQTLGIDKSAKICYDLLSIINNYGEELQLNYSFSEKINKPKRFSLSYESIIELLKEGVNREESRIFDNLGKSIHILSSMNNNTSCSIRIRIDCSFEKFYNTVIVKLPHEGFSGLTERTHDLEIMFKKMIMIFNPFFAFVSNNLNDQISDQYWNNNLPTFVHWLNYWDMQTSQKNWC